MRIRGLIGVTVALVAIGLVLLGRDDGARTAAGTDATLAAVAGPTTVILVRHAEKADDGTADPPLTDAGRDRSAALADVVEDAGLTAIYSTQFRRTQQTAAAVAERVGVPVTTLAVEDGAEAYAEAQARRIRERHAGETVLVAGHSNTVPPLVEALGAPEIAPIPDHGYDRLVIVLVRADGSADLIESRYGAASAGLTAAAAAR